jgi:hypothetical protein
MFKRSLEVVNYSRLVSHFENRLRHASLSEAAIAALKCGVLAHRGQGSERDIISLYLHPELTCERVDEFTAKLPRLLRNSIRNTELTLSDQSIAEEDGFTRYKFSGGRAAVSTKIAVTAPSSLSEEARIRDLNSIWSCALSPDARALATLMLVAKGVSETGLPLSDILNHLNHPRPIVIITCPVRGFVDEFSLLLRAGFVLSGKTELITGAEVTSKRSVPRRTTRSRSRVAILLTGRDFNPDNSVSLKDLLRCELPIVYLDEDSSRVPEQLLIAANLHIRCNFLSEDIIKHLIDSASGDVPPDALSRIIWTMLDLDDLSLAVRLGNTRSQSVALLERLSHARLKPAESGGVSKSLASSSDDWVEPALPAHIRKRHERASR